MTTDDAQTLPPDRVAELLDELDQRAAERERAEQEQARASARCREIVVQLLRARAVERRALVDRPFSSAALTIIQNEEGLTRKRRR